MSPICILGIGSPFGDDRLGWEAIEMLKQHAKISSLIPHMIHLEICDRPATRLLHKFEHVKIAILIDAIKSERPLGTIHSFSNDDIFTIKHSASTHGLGISESLNLGKTLNMLPNVTVLYGIEINEVALTTELSSIAKTALKKLVNSLSLLKWDKLIKINSKETIVDTLLAATKK